MNRLIQLINKIRSYFVPKLEDCPCVICYNERRVEDKALERLGA